MCVSPKALVRFLVHSLVWGCAQRFDRRTEWPSVLMGAGFHGRSSRQFAFPRDCLPILVDNSFFHPVAYAVTNNGAPVGCRWCGIGAVQGSLLPTESWVVLPFWRMTFDLVGRMVQRPMPLGLCCGAWDPAPLHCFKHCNIPMQVTMLLW